MSNHIFNGGLLNIESKGIVVPALILAAASIASRLLGLLRNWLLANNFGAGPDLDVYFAAFRIPDFIYNVLVFGGIIVAFLPLFSDYYAKSKEDAWRFANNTLNVFFVLLVLLSLVLFIFTPQLVYLIAPGFTPEQLAKTALLSRLMFLSPIIFGIASIFSGVLQYFRRFLAYSFAASLYNLGIIAGILFLAPQWGILGVAGGVIIGALLYLLIQVVPAVKCGFRYKPVLNFREPSLYRVIKLMLPRTAGIAANQINLIAPTIIASTLAAGSITVFNLASDIYSIPVGIIGVSWATAAFVVFSKYFAQGQMDKLAQKFASVFRQVGYLVVPAGFLLFILRDDIVALMYRHGQFTAESAILTSASLGLFCLSIYFSSLVPVMLRLFFSLRDTISPTLTTVAAVAVNIVFNYLFVIYLNDGALAGIIRRIFGLEAVADISVLGLALAYSFANMMQFAMLLYLIWRKKSGIILGGQITASFLKTFFAGIVMSLAVWLINATIPRCAGRCGLLMGQIDLGLLVDIIILAALGVIVYFAATVMLRSPEPAELKEFLSRRKERLG